MQWPTANIAHVGDYQAANHPAEWRVRPYDPEWGTYKDTFRTCTFCGSISPENLYNLCQHHPIELQDADWKYGWPHKFYVEGIPNPVAGQKVNVGQRSEWENGKTVHIPIVGTAPPTTHAKFYTDHFRDLVAPEYHEAFEALSREVEMRSRGQVKITLKEQEEGGWTFQWRGIPQGVPGLHY